MGEVLKGNFLLDHLLRDAMQRMVRYGRVVTDAAQMQFGEDARHCWVELGHVPVDPPPAWQAVDAFAAILVRTARALDRTLWSRNRSEFLPRLAQATLVGLFGAWMRILYGYLQARLTWKWRKKLTDLFHSKYFSGFNYYWLGAGGGRGLDKIEDPDLRFVIGSGSVIPGFEEGITGMTKGAVRQLVIKPQIGYPADDPSHERVGPKPSTFSGKQALNFVLQNQELIDKTLLFNVKLVRIDKGGASGEGVKVDGKQDFDFSSVKFKNGGVKF